MRLVVLLLVLTSCGRTEPVEGLAGAGGGGVDALPPGCVPAASPAAADTELRTRWNAAVDADRSLTRDFHWTNPDDFPHPSFRKGDATAYAEFSTVLVRFWRTADTLDFARCNQLLDKEYLSGPKVAVQKRFRLRQLTSDLSTFRLVPAAQQQELQALCATIGC